MAKQVCSSKEFWKVIEKHGGLRKLRVLSSYTYFDEELCSFGAGTHIYTEWGDKDGNFVCESEEHNDDKVYRREQ